ncbi:CatB-related O-acetyltransferase [Leclercia tamurae]|uniref:CatB-related O-acetyltransferase n=1 Tax=Leclercia tamurae TaxID=2926467 RepID=A0ABT2REL9_9ENTR|nr:CatB-related O-acetyltransferase [Leclercia tamurae]MCU6679351.1 CatB-related O-acetyltransferase [Leclercia tamurae]
MTLNNDIKIKKLMRELSSLHFKMSREDGSYMIYPIRLLEGGEISGHYNENEYTWKIINGELFFYAKNGQASTAFGKPFLENGELTFKGCFLLVPEWKIKHKLKQIDFSYDSLDVNTMLTRSTLKDNIQQFRWEVGNHTYGTPSVMEARMAGLRIGKFCSIGPGVTIILGNHVTNTATTYPFSSLSLFWPGARRDYIEDHDTKGDVKIGNDVWIGKNATIMSGVNIGDGAIIAANSVVTKDVRPYSIVGGNPAKLLRMRHCDDIIDALLQIQWWNWSDEEIDNSIKYLMSDVNAFITRFKK